MSSFRTTLLHSPSPTPINHAHQLLLIGSCFTEHIGQKLCERKFNTLINPFGIVYNPHSIAQCINRLFAENQAFEAETASERTIEPVGIFHDHNNWYVFGFCHLRNDYRQFRTDRIEGIKKTEIKFTKEHETLETYLNKGQQHPTTKVRLLIDKKISKYLAYEKKYHGFISQKNVDDNRNYK